MFKSKHIYTIKAFSILQETAKRWIKMDLVLYVELIVLWWSGWVIGWLMRGKSQEDSYWGRVEERIRNERGSKK